MAHNFKRKIQTRAHELWLLEGRPEGREALHWEIAKEVVARDEVLTSLLPSGSDAAEIVGVVAAMDNVEEEGTCISPDHKEVDSA